LFLTPVFLAGQFVVTAALSCTREGFFVLHPSRFLCPASCCPSKEVLAELIRDISRLLTEEVSFIVSMFRWSPLRLPHQYLSFFPIAFHDIPCPTKQWAHALRNHPLTTHALACTPLSLSLFSSLASFNFVSFGCLCSIPTRAGNICVFLCSNLSLLQPSVNFAFLFEPSQEQCVRP